MIEVEEKKLKENAIKLATDVLNTDGLIEREIKIRISNYEAPTIEYTVQRTIGE